MSCDAVAASVTPPHRKKLRRCIAKGAGRRCCAVNSEIISFHPGARLLGRSVFGRRLLGVGGQLDIAGRAASYAFARENRFLGVAMLRLERLMACIIVERKQY